MEKVQTFGRGKVWAPIATDALRLGHAQSARTPFVARSTQIGAKTARRREPIARVAQFDPENLSLEGDEKRFVLSPNPPNNRPILPDNRPVFWKNRPIILNNWPILGDNRLIFPDNRPILPENWLIIRENDVFLQPFKGSLPQGFPFLQGFSSPCEDRLPRPLLVLDAPLLPMLFCSIHYPDRRAPFSQRSDKQIFSAKGFEKSVRVI